jgi:hypothetical protein
VITEVMLATRMVGTAKRTVCDKASTSRVVRRHQVAGAGPLDRRQGQRDDPLHELLAQLGEDLLAEDEGLPPREPGHHGLHHDGDGEHGCEPVDVGDPGARPHLVDQAAEQSRAGQPGERSERVQRQHEAEAAPVLPHQQLRLAPHARRSRDGQAGSAHSSSPRTTVRR